MEEKQILDRLWNRDEEALHMLSQHYGHRLQRLAHNILMDPQDAKECVNDTYLALWNSIPPKRPEPLLPYALRVCKNIATSRLRRKLAKKRSGYEIALEELCHAVGSGGPEEKLEADALGRAINDFLARQNKENRVIFLRRYWYGDSVQQIAGRLAMSENVVSTRLARMKGKLRQQLIKEELYVG